MVRKKIIKPISLILLLSILVSLMPLNINDIFAASHNVNQSRRHAEISEFPLSYQPGLTRIKDIYPNAQFIYYDTGLDWDEVLSEENQMKTGYNLIPSSSPSSWKSTAPDVYNPRTNTYEQIEPGWNQASRKLVEHYMDPRNFFNERDIFQFLNLAFDESQTVDGTQSVLKGSFMENRTIKDNDGNEISYAQALYQIGKEVGISPYLLACRIRQEQGGGGSALISGTYSKYPGYYNYFNIGAYGSTTEKIITNGLKEAKENGWDSRYKAIAGGAKILSSNYVEAGKNCLYLQHFNMTTNSDKTVNYSVYMANTIAPYHENKMMTSSITDTNAPYTFIIPVYRNMPEKPCELPSGDGNGSHLLKGITINNGNLDIGEFSSYNYDYTVKTTNESFVTIKLSTYSDKSKVYINGISINMQDGSSAEKALMVSGGFNDFTITVEAENGLCRDYILHILNDDGKSYYRGVYAKITNEYAELKSGTTVDALRNDISTINCSIIVVDAENKAKNGDQICTPNDTIMIKNVNNEIIYTGPIFISGDVNVDGYVNTMDVELTKTHILETYTLTLNERKLADMNGDAKITIDDLAKMKLTANEEFDPYKSSISITPNVPAEMYDGKTITVSLNADKGTYFAEGYLVYNEGRVKLSSGENSGRIHFIADGNKVLFENGSDSVKFKNIIRSGSLDFSVEIINAYDYTSEKNIEIDTTPSSAFIKNSELQVDVTFNGSATEGDKNFNCINMRIENIAAMSIGNVSIVLGDGLVNEDGTQEQLLAGFKPGIVQDFKIYAVNGLSSGTYSSFIKIYYQDANCVESLMQIPVSFTVLEHEHTEWKQNDSEHYIDCKICGDKTTEKHNYRDLGNNMFICAQCGHQKNYTLKLNNDSAIINKATVITPVITLNNKDVDLSGWDVKWYVNNTQVTASKALSLIFKSIGYRNIDCIMTSPDGIVVRGSTQIFVGTKQAANRISIDSVTCNSITVKKENGYEYRLDNGKWQSSPTFNNLSAGKEYVVYRRLKSTKSNMTSIRVEVSHNIKNYIDLNSACGADISQQGICDFCNGRFTKTLKGTAHDHIFANYSVTSEATCKNGTIKTALCEYGCGQSSTIEGGNVQLHSFTQYVFDNNSTCVSGGTKTALCNYGCGTKDTIPVTAETAGHTFEYRANADATIDHGFTETGICTHCGTMNTRTVDGTRLIVVDKININLLAATTEEKQLPAISIDSEGVELVDFVWKNSGGVEVSKIEDLQLKSGETYTLSSLTIKVDQKHAYHEKVVLFINGSMFIGESQVNGNAITFINVGQFKF